jgi:hypothetical protein
VLVTTDQSIFAQTLPPALKRKFPINWYIVDATMHLLKGLGENGVEYVANWVKKYNKHPHVCRLTKKLLELMYSCQLSWLGILPFGGKIQDSTCSWLSESFIDFVGWQPLCITYVWKKNCLKPITLRILKTETSTNPTQRKNATRTYVFVPQPSIAATP